MKISEERRGIPGDVRKNINGPERRWLSRILDEDTHGPVDKIFFEKSLTSEIEECKIVNA